MPWNAFVAAFLYYALLALLSVGGVSPSGAVVATAYLAPVVAYAVVVTFRLMGAAVRPAPVRLRNAPTVP
jgi:hypothetical protein